MLIVSWNVAGLKPALQKINSDYGASSSVDGGDGGSNANDKSNSKSTSSSFDPLANYLALHNSISILCLQEHKIPLAQLSSRCEPQHCSSIPGYESFWSCATAQNSRGFNGVCTYAKIGLVKSANAHPLGDPALDDQGRCIMTDHGKFVLFNVYVPCGRGVGDEAAENLHSKMKFLNALSASMDEQRQLGKHVVLVGDMNAKLGKRDVFWSWRMVNVDEILEQVKHQQHQEEKCSENNKDEEHVAETFPKWKRDVAEHWGKIETALQTLEVISRQTTNPSTKKTFDRFRARIKVVGNDTSYAMLGNYEDEADEAVDCYTFDERRYIDPTNNTSTIYRKKNLLCVDTLAELMYKVANVSWGEKTMREIAESKEADLNPDSPVHNWMKARVSGSGDGMVDVFRHFYPTAEARFTCWHQLRNMRYTNEGTRIDYTFIDRPLLDHVQPNENKTFLRCGTKEPHSNPLGEEAALMAATANGMFESGSYAGGGIAVATKRALDTQFGEAHTGMIYTPPSYSDHIAVSLLMKSSFNDYVGELELENDSATRKAQPHKKQRSISSFFGAAAAGGGSKKSSSSSLSTIGGSSKSSSKSATSGEKRSMSQDTNNISNKTAKKKSSLQSYFGGSKQAAKENGSSGSKSSSANNKKQRSVPKNSVLKHFGKK